MCRRCWREEMGLDPDGDSDMDGVDSDIDMDDDSPRGMNHLPNEILDQICHYLSPNDLKTLRLVCNKPAITACLFKQCHLEPTTDSYKALAKLFQSPRCKQHVRKVIYSLTHSTDLDNFDKYNGKRDRRYWKAVDKGEDLVLFEFPNADALEIRFQDFRPYEAVWWPSSVDDEEDSFDENENTLFSAINFGSHWLQRLLPPAYKKMKPLSSLTILNLPNHPMHITHDKKFKFARLMKGLRELHLSVDTMISSQRQFLGPKLGYIGHYVDLWLKPTTNNLTSLSLHMKGYWGPFYGLSFQALEFTKLRHLTLWNFALLYEVQFDWILKHKHLETLNLIGCPIVVHMEVDHPVDCEHCGLLRRKDFTGDVSTTDMGWFVWRNELRWAPFLTRIKKELKKLRSFSLAAGHQYELESGWKEKGTKSYAEWPEDDILPSDLDEDDDDDDDDDEGEETEEDGDNDSDDMPGLVSSTEPNAFATGSSEPPSVGQDLGPSAKKKTDNNDSKNDKDEDSESVSSFDEANDFFAEELDDHDEIYETTFEEDWFWMDNDINHDLLAQFENTDRLPEGASFVERDNFPAWIYRHRYIALRMDSTTEIWCWSNWNEPKKWWGLVRNVKFNYEEQDEEEKALRDLLAVVRQRNLEV